MEDVYIIVYIANESCYIPVKWEYKYSCVICSGGTYRD
jgi:hypothetical protein